MALLLLFLALLGHACLWVALVNRIHATRVGHWTGHFLSLVCLLGMLLLPAGFLWWWPPAGVALSEDRFRQQTSAAATPSLAAYWITAPAAAVVYLGACWITALAIVVQWTRHGPWRRAPAVLRFHRVRPNVLADEAAGADSRDHARHFLARLPGNQILRLDVVQCGIEVPRLPRALDGLSIIHFSDTHFTGRVGKGYFQDLVRVSNESQPDLVAVTGDLLDRTDFIDWIPDTLGRLRARYGVYFVLGNHDLRADLTVLRRALGQCGLIDLGGRWIEVTLRGERVLLAGNELPWIRPAADLGQCPSGKGRPLRIALAHSPDQLPWAQAHGIDLLLAGHTHGGQIRLPLIGPVFSPCRSGVRYASGVFHSPPTVMHVTRGVSAELPIRLNCPPEMAHLLLHAPQ